MSAAHLLRELEVLGVKVWPDGGALRFKAPAGVMTEELTAQVVAAKPELLQLLTPEVANDDSDPAQDLPLLAAAEEFETLIERLCDLRRYPADVREEMRATRKRMSPNNVRAELSWLRNTLLKTK